MNKQDTLTTDISALSQLLSTLSTNHNVPLDNLLDLIKQRAHHPTSSVFPSSILQHDKLGVLQVVVKYLREHHNLRFSEIAKLVSRSERVVWVTYQQAKQKDPTPLVISDKTQWLPCSLFSNPRFGPLKAVVTYLRDFAGLSFKHIGDLIGRDNRVVWAVYHRKSTKKVKS